METNRQETDVVEIDLLELASVLWSRALIIAAVAVTLCTKAPGRDVEALFDKAMAYSDD